MLTPDESAAIKAAVDALLNAHEHWLNGIAVVASPAERKARQEAFYAALKHFDDLRTSYVGQSVP